MIAADMPAAAGMTTTAVPAVMTTTTGAAATEAGSATPAATPRLPVADGTSAGKIAIMMTGAAIPAARTITMIAVPDMTTMTADGAGMVIPVVTRKPHGADGMSDATTTMMIVAVIPAATMTADIRAGTMIVVQAAVAVMAAGSVILAATRKLPAGVGMSAGTMTTAIAAVARTCSSESETRVWNRKCSGHRQTDGAAFGPPCKNERSFQGISRWVRKPRANWTSLPKRHAFATFGPATC